MKQTIILLLSCLFLSSCIGLNLPGIGGLQTDPGVRVYKSDDKVLLHITHKQGETVNYKDMQPILEGVFK